MSTAELSTPLSPDWPVPSPGTLAQLVHQLGDIPLDRILTTPPPGAATEQDLLKGIEGKICCELVDGVLVVKAMGYFESVLAMELAYLLLSYLRQHPLGAVAGEQGISKLIPGLIRTPDVSFVTSQRLSAAKSLVFCPGAPDLCIEILSAGNTKREMERKVSEYFEHGASLVWFIEPRTRTAQVFTSATDVENVAADGILDGQHLLPSLQISLRELFATVERQLGQIDEPPHS